MKESTNVPIVKRVSSNCHNFDNIQDYILVCLFYIFIQFFNYYSKVSAHQNNDSSTLQQFQLVFSLNQLVTENQIRIMNLFPYFLLRVAVWKKKSKSNHIWLMVTKWCYYKNQTFILALFYNFPWVSVDFNAKCR